MRLLTRWFTLIPSSQLAPYPLLAHLDGILLTGSHSNIEPHHYSDEPSYEGNFHDPQRDATTLSLIHVAVRTTAWKTPDGCRITHDSGSHMRPVRTPTPSGSDVTSVM